VTSSLPAVSIAAILTLVSPSAFAEVPLWHSVKGDYSQYDIFVDPAIVADQRLAFVLTAELKSAEHDENAAEAWARQAIKDNEISSPRQDNEEKLQLLGANAQYAAILTSSASCSLSCGSAQVVEFYHLADHRLLKPAEILDLAGQIELLNRLAKRDDALKIGPYLVKCDPSKDAERPTEEECQPLSGILDHVVGVVDPSGTGDTRRFTTAKDIDNLAKEIYLGFTADKLGRVTTLDFYIPYAPNLLAHSQAFRWSINAKEAAPLLRPEFQELAASTMTAEQAADPKPDATIKNPSIEASVFLDGKIKSDAALSADCLAEGRKWIDKNAAEAAAARKEDPDAFRDGSWSFERNYAVNSEIADRYISVVRSDEIDTSGAHPNSDVDTILWDRAQKKRISIRPFFTETADNGATMKAMLRSVISALNAEKKQRGTSDTATAEWYQGLEPKLLKIGAVTLTPSTEASRSAGLTFYYPPDAVGSHAEGAYVVFVPWSTLKPYLNPEGQRIFGGKQPKVDDDAKQ
jgi:hypothetical protein